MISKVKKNRSVGRAVTVSFQVKQEDWPALYDWMTGLEHGVKSSKIRSILGEAARLANSRGAPTACHDTWGPTSQVNHCSTPISASDGQPATDSGLNATADADNQLSADALILAMMEQF